MESGNRTIFVLSLKFTTANRGVNLLFEKSLKSNFLVAMNQGDAKTVLVCRQVRRSANLGVSVAELLVFDAVRNVMLDVFDLDDLVLSDATVAQDVPDWDSLSHIRLIVAVEKHFGIRFTTAEIEGLDNVGALVNAISARVSAAA